MMNCWVWYDCCHKTSACSLANLQYILLNMRSLSVFLFYLHTQVTERALFCWQIVLQLVWKMDLFTIVSTPPLWEDIFPSVSTWILTNVRGFVNEPENLSPVWDFIPRNSLLVCWVFSFVQPQHDALLLWVGVLRLLSWKAEAKKEEEEEERSFLPLPKRSSATWIVFPQQFYG
jgi:hypothetical protein